MIPSSLLEVILQHHDIPAEADRRRQIDSYRLPSAAEFYVRKLPGLDQSSRIKLYAGHLPAFDTAQGEQDDQPYLFFLLSRAKHIADKPRLVIWFNGGPGCSSFDGALMEIGPVRVASMDRDGPKLEEASTTWSEYADVLYVDQPAGTGYSYLAKGDPVTELDAAADQVIQFLQNFYRVFPEFAETQTFIAGESFAGMYIPYIADAMLKTSRITAPLKGIMIGNAWIDPETQYMAYADYSYQNKLLVKDSPSGQRLDDAVALCNTTLHGSGSGQILVNRCENLLGLMVPPPKMLNGKQMCVNLYNVTEDIECGRDWPRGLRQVTPYLRDANVISAFHAEEKHTPWTQCNGTISQQMATPESQPAVELLPSLLEKIDVLFFAGEQDAMCNWLGVERSLQKLEWDAARGFGNETVLDWRVNGTVVGNWITSRRLTWARITNASHMVPIDQPLAAHDMLIRFTGMDMLRAAGSSGKVPSRLGAEAVAVIKETHPNGTSLETAIAAGDPELLSGDLLVDADSEEVQAREEYYGPRRTAVLVLLLLLVITLLVLLVRFISRRRLRKAQGVDMKFSRSKEGQRPRSRNGRKPDPEMYALVDGRERD